MSLLSSLKKTSSGIVAMFKDGSSVIVRGDTEGQIGEKVTFTPQSITCTNAATWYASASSGTLGIGTWLICGNFSFDLAAGADDIIMAAISDNNSANATNIGDAFGRAQKVLKAGTSNNPFYALATGYAVVTSPVTIYMKALTEDQTGQVIDVNGYAVRIR